jgi:hypothetical protein
MESARFIAKYMCNAEDPDATRTWFIIDSKIGVPLADENGIRYFSKEEVKAFLNHPISAV